MNELRRPLPLGLFAVGIGLFIIGQPVIGAIALILWVSVLALASLRKTAEIRAEDTSDSLDPEARALFAPIRRLTAEIEEIVSRNSDSALIRTVGAEVEAEARRIRDQMVHALTIRGDLKRTLRDRGTAELETKQMEERLSDAGPDERTSLETALAARRQELEHFLSVETAINQIDGGVQQAKSALSEMKTKLSVGASGERAATDTSGDNLRESLANLRALTLSFDEAEEVLGDKG